MLAVEGSRDPNKTSIALFEVYGYEDTGIHRIDCRVKTNVNEC